MKGGSQSRPMGLNKKAPNGMVTAWGVNSIQKPVGKEQDALQPANRPTEFRCYIKEENPQYGAAGAETLSRTEVLRLPYNSPFWQHFTQGLLLCSRFMIQDNEQIVKTYFAYSISKYCYFQGRFVYKMAKIEASGFRLQASDNETRKIIPFHLWDSVIDDEKVQFLGLGI